MNNKTKKRKLKNKTSENWQKRKTKIGEEEKL